MRFNHARTLALVLFLTGACAPFQVAKTPDDALVEVDPSEHPAFADDLSFAGLNEALAHSLAYVKRVTKWAPDRTVAFGRERVPLSKVGETIEKLQALIATQPSPAEFRAVLRRDFRVFRSTGGDRDGTVLFTGYYLPELRGSLEPSGVFTHPLLAPPTDVVVAKASDFPQLDRDLLGFVDNGRLLPLPVRESIRTGALDGKAAPVVWVDSVVDAFFLHIQGSGVVKLPDGSTQVVSYAGKNGHPYRAIGGELVRRGALKREDVSMQSIRAWLDANPDEQDLVLSTNPSYVFFQLGDAPRGSINVPVTPGRSIATDTNVFPKGAPCFIETQRPVDATSNKWVDFSRFVVDQDTGGAIKTAARVDIYWGSGDYAQHAAGHLKHPGRLWYLLAR